MDDEKDEHRHKKGFETLGDQDHKDASDHSLIDALYRSKRFEPADLHGGTVFVKYHGKASTDGSLGLSKAR